MDTRIEIIKSSAEKMTFSLEKLRASLGKSGADNTTVDEIIEKVQEELYNGISTKEIYNRTFALLKKKGGSLASRHKHADQNELLLWMSDIKIVLKSIPHPR